MVTDERKETIAQGIIEEHKMRRLNNKDSMLIYLEDYVKNFVKIPEGIAKFEGDSKQMSLKIFERYICFDYPGAEIEVRYTPENGSEIYVGAIVFTNTNQRPLWKDVDGEQSNFHSRTLDNFMGIAFSSFD